MRKIKVFFFGDSICFGQGVSIHKGWVPRLSEGLYQLGKQRDRDIVVVNASISGNSTRQALERMPYEVQSHSPDIMVVQFGMNDCNYWESDKGGPRVSPKAFGANLEEIFMRGLRFGAKQIIVNTNHPTTRNDKCLPHTDITYQQSNADYNNIIRESASNFKGAVILNDIAAVFQKKLDEGTVLNELLLDDGLHLSEAGHDLYFCEVRPLLERVLIDNFS